MARDTDSFTAVGRLATATRTYLDAIGEAADTPALLALYDVATREPVTAGEAYAFALVACKAERMALLGEIAELRRRVATLESSPAAKGIEYLGTYTPSRQYAKNNAVTSGGSLWIAVSDTRERPGDGATGWRLAAKRGRDGRDAA